MPAPRTSPVEPNLLPGYINRIMLPTVRSITLAVLLAGIPLFAAAPAFDPSMLRNGDIIFQTSRSGQSQAIQLATRSPISHCGIVFFQSGKPYVFEASTKVKRTPFKRFIRKGADGKFAVKRLGNADSLLTPIALKRLQAEGLKLEGRPYDSFFSWDDDRIYCSELVYKIYRNALGLEIGTTGRLQDFDLTHPIVAAKLRERYGGHIPQTDSVISPAAQFHSPNLIEVFNNF